MSELVTLARPYANAVFKRAKETNSSEIWSEKLSYLRAVLSDALITSVVNDPKISKSKLSELLFEICGSKLENEGCNFLKLLIENKRLNLISAITELFETYKAFDENCIDVDVITAYDFSKEDEEHFGAILQNVFCKKVNMRIAIDASLIGGVLVRAGDQVIDGSVRGQLQQLAQRL